MMFPETPTIIPHTGPSTYAVRTVPNESSQSGRFSFSARMRPTAFRKQLASTRKNIWYGL